MLIICIKNCIKKNLWKKEIHVLHIYIYIYIYIYIAASCRNNILLAFFYNEII